MPVIASRKPWGRATVALLASLLGLAAPARAEPLQWYSVPAPGGTSPGAGPAAPALPGALPPIAPIAPIAPVAPVAPRDAADLADLADLAALVTAAPAPPGAPRAAPLAPPARSTARPGAPATPSPAAAAAPQYDALVADAAHRHALDPLLVHAVVAAESAYRPEVVSPKGAVGLMQVMPATGARFGKTVLTEPRENLEAGTAYLGWLMQRFGGRLDLALAGYNAGEGAVARYGNVVPPYAETQAYVRKVLTHYASLRGERPGEAGPGVLTLSGVPRAPVARVPPILSAAPVAPSAAKPRATGGLGDVGQWVQLFTGGSGRAHAAATPRL